MNAISLSAGRIELHMEWIPMGESLCVAVFGGSAHIGAAAVSERDGKLLTVCKDGHREDELCELIAGALSRADIPCAVVGGVHYDGITRTEIDTVMALTMAGAERLIREWREECTQKEEHRDTTRKCNCCN